MARYSISYITQLTFEQLRPLMNKENSQRIIDMYNQAKAYSVQRYNRVQAALERRNRYYRPLDLYTTNTGKERIRRDFIPSQDNIMGTIHELFAYRDYLRAYTSTIEGARREAYSTIKRVEDVTGYRIPYYHYNEFWELYEKARNEIGNAVVGGKYEMWRKIGEVNESANYKINSWEDFKKLFESRYFPTNYPEEMTDEEVFEEFYENIADLFGGSRTKRD